MSFWSELAVGDEAALVRAAEEGDLRSAEPVTIVDLPGVLPDDDEGEGGEWSPETLTACAAELAGQPLRFADATVRRYDADDGGHGYRVMAPAWTALMASVDPERLAQQWIARGGDALRSDDTDGLRASARAVVETCAIARRHPDAAVLWYWTL